MRCCVCVSESERERGGEGERGSLIREPCNVSGYGSPLPDTFSPARAATAGSPSVFAL